MNIDESGSSNPPDWLVRLSDDVFHGALKLIRKHARSAAQAAALENVVEALRPRSKRPETPPALLSLPSLVFAALGGEGERALGAAIATALFGCGVDVLDDLADGDRPERWHDYSVTDMMLIATELCCALPPLALADLDAPPTTILAMQQTLARGFLRASAGQRLDLASRARSVITAEEALTCAEGKAGAFLAILTTMPAQLAGANPAIVWACASFGRNLGTAISIREDCDDLFGTDWSRDLRTGTRSYPIAVHLERLVGTDQSHFVDLLDRARDDWEAQTEVRRHLRAKAVELRSNITIALYCEQAQRRLTRARCREPALSLLKSIVDAVI